MDDDRDLPLSLLRIAKAATNYYDGELAALVGMKRSTVQAVVSGRCSEYLTEEQKALLVRAVKGHIRLAEQKLAELELFA